MGFRNPLYSANQITSGALTRIRYRTARTGQRIEFRPHVDPASMQLFSAGATETGPGEVSTEYGPIMQGDPLLSPLTKLVSPTIAGDPANPGAGRAYVTAHPATADRPAGALVHDAIGNLAPFHASGFLDANDFPAVMWTDTNQVRVNAYSFTGALDVNGEKTLDHDLGVVPRFAVVSIGRSLTSYSVECDLDNTNVYVRVFITNTGAVAAGAVVTLHLFAIG